MKLIDAAEAQYDNYSMNFSSKKADQFTSMKTDFNIAISE